MKATSSTDAKKKPDIHLATSGARKERLPLGESLVKIGAISQEQLQDALRQQKHHKGVRLGRLLVKLGFISDDVMRQALSEQLNVPFVDLERMRIDPALGRIINHAYARRHCLLPVSSIGQSLTVCMDDPSDQTVVGELKRITGYSISVVTASHESIKAAFARLYSEALQGPSGGTVETGVMDLQFDEEAEDVRVNNYGYEFKGADVIVQKLLAVAIEQRTSDIHIETLSNRIGIRFRIDGLLQAPQLGDIEAACNQLGREMVSRFKILAKLDIAERRRPQDGSFRVRVSKGEELITIDLRVSIIPSMHGESVVIRVLDKSRLPASIDGLGLPKTMVVQFGQLLKRSAGILLVTGPTGSGKSTTLYAALKTLYKPQIRILTAEDPIEYVYEQFSQCEVNDQIGNTFAKYLRSFLRHDPEVIMIGEIRDSETAQMALRAAQTGHLLMSTLHTTTAVESVSRLRDLGIDSNTIASTIAGVLGQRLVRRVCKDCKSPYQPSKHLIDQLPFSANLSNWELVKGSGCPACNFTGFSGRVMVGELWVPTQDDAVMIAKEVPADELAASSKASTFTMSQCASELLHEQVTNIEELVRVMPFSAIREMLEAAPAEQMVG
ncbi:MAG TPA: GspE/PulE family protein [Vicinamibacterales bacterium]|nr:GspE/PulE family protein [Vicinamibacterales bacterium]